MSKYQLKNKRIILTGASSGIGKALTLILIEKYDCKVLGVGRNAQKMEEVKSCLTKKENFTYKLFDVSKLSEWQNFANELESDDFYPDMLVNNAGYLPKFAKTENNTIFDAENVMNVNYFSCVYSFNALLPLLNKSNSPAVINVSSSAALAPVVGTAYYSASKAAVKSFTEVLAQDYKNFYVATVMPGFTKTNIFVNQKYGKNEDKLINKLCSPVEKVAKKCVKKIKRRKKRIILGVDAKLMNFFYKLFPQATTNIIRSVLKKADLELFEEVF